MAEFWNLTGVCLYSKVVARGGSSHPVDSATLAAFLGPTLPAAHQ